MEKSVSGATPSYASRTPLTDIFITESMVTRKMLHHSIFTHLKLCLATSPGNEVIVDHWKWTKMLTKVFQRNLTLNLNLNLWGYVKPPIKPYPNPPSGKPRFRVKSKMAAIKLVIYVNF